MCFCDVQGRCHLKEQTLFLAKCINQYIYIYFFFFEKLHTVVSTHLLYVGSNCCKAQGLDESVEDRLNLNTAPQFGTLVVPHCLYKKDCC